jgi:hypothetical protein
MLPFVEFPSMSGPSDVNRIAEQVVEGPPREYRTAMVTPIGSNPLLAAIAICLQVVVEIEDRS